MCWGISAGSDCVHTIWEWSLANGMVVLAICDKCECREVQDEKHVLFFCKCAEVCELPLRYRDLVEGMFKTFCVSSVVHWHCFFSYSLYSDQTFSGSPLPYFWSAFSFSGIQLLSCDSPSVLQTWSFLFHISFLALFLMFLMNVSPFVKLGVVTGFFQASAQMPPEAYIAM